MELTPAPRVFEWSIATDLHALAAVAEQFESAAQSAGIPPTNLLRLTLAVEEVVTNAIKYGYDDGLPGRIDISMRITPGEAEVIIADDGKPFDPASAPEADIDTPIADRHIGGLGIHLIRNFTDSLDYQRRDNRNVLRLTHRFVPESGSAVPDSASTRSG
jgi:anti-sigma regulatory factor (Ser/Thr protein kinase)